MKMIIDFADVKMAEFTNKESGEVINYKTVAVDFGSGVKYMSLNSIKKGVDALKMMM